MDIKLVAGTVLAAAVAAAPVLAADAAVGKKLYEGKCASCHAKDGRGNPAMAKMFKLDVAALDLAGEGVKAPGDAELAPLISKGKGKMPAFAGKLSEGDISDVVAYLRGLKAQAAATQADPGSGAKLYAAKCASCHGKDGKGNPAMAKMFKVTPEALNLSGHIALHPDAEHIKTISNGRGKMPAFKDKLKDAEIADVIAYIHALAPKADAAEKEPAAK